MAIEIVDFPIKNGWIFHSYVKLPAYTSLGYPSFASWRSMPLRLSPSRWFISLVSNSPKYLSGVIQWIGLRENLQETRVIFPLNMGFSCKNSLKPSH
jgi:hypothetical protein